MAEQLQNPAAPQGLAVLATPGGARAATAAATPGMGRFEFADDVAGIMQVGGDGWNGLHASVVLQAMWVSWQDEPKRRMRQHMTCKGQAECAQWSHGAEHQPIKLAPHHAPRPWMLEPPPLVCPHPEA